MRPTFLQFRSPKERTPDPYDARVTCNGSFLEYKRKKSLTFSKTKRFKQYDFEAKKTGYMVGPGSYNSLNTVKVKGAYSYKPLYGIQGDLQDCFYVGNNLVLDSPEKTPMQTDSD